MTTPPEDHSLRRAQRCVWFCGAVLALAGGAWGGLWWTFSIGVGAFVAALNLLVLVRTVEQLVEGKRASWGAVAVVKFVALLALLHFLINGGWVAPLALAVGLAALPLGIVVAGFLFPLAPSGTPGPLARSGRPVPLAPSADAFPPR